MAQLLLGGATTAAFGVLGAIFLDWRRERRRRSAAIALVGAEIDSNRALLDRFLGDPAGRYPRALNQLDVEEWGKRRSDLSYLARNDDVLWGLLSAAYGTLRAINAGIRADAAFPLELEQIVWRLRQHDPYRLPLRAQAKQALRATWRSLRFRSGLFLQRQRRRARARLGLSPRAPVLRRRRRPRT